MPPHTFDVTLDLFFHRRRHCQRLITKIGQRHLLAKLHDRTSFGGENPLKALVQIMVVSLRLESEEYSAFGVHWT